MRGSDKSVVRNLRNRGWHRGAVMDEWHRTRTAWIAEKNGCRAHVFEKFYDCWYYEVKSDDGMITGNAKTFDKAIYLCEVAMQEGFPMYGGLPEAGLDYLVTVYALTEYAEQCRIPEPNVSLINEMQSGCWSALHELYGTSFREICKRRGWVDEDGDPDGYVTWLAFDRATMYRRTRSAWRNGIYCEPLSQKRGLIG